MNRRLYRSNEHKIIGGVCGGLGEHFDIDPTWVRLGFVVLTIVHGVGLLLYIIGWIIIPKRQVDIGETPGSTSEPSSPAGSTAKSKSGKASSLLPGLILIGLGVVFLLHESFWWFDFEFVWPMILVVVGGALVYRALESRREPEDEQEVANESG